MAKHLNIDQAKQIANAVIAKVRNKGYAVKGEIVKADLAAALQTEIESKAAQTDLNTVSGKVTTLIGTDTDKSVRTIANEELAAQLIPASAKEALDTLEEIAAWIQDHPDDVAEINSRITALQTKTELGTYTPAGGGDPVQYATVKAYVEAYVAEQIGDAGLSEGNGIDITNKIVSIVIDTANANGLALTAAGLKANLATPSTSGVGGSNGMLSATDKEKLDSIEFATSTDITNLINALDSLDPVSGS